VGADDEADVHGQVRLPRQHRAVAADLLGKDLTPFGPEVALDEQGDRPPLDPDPGQRVWPEKAAEELATRPLRDPGEEPLRSIK
jgi:hypothetical protein